MSFIATQAALEKSELTGVHTYGTHFPALYFAESAPWLYSALLLGIRVCSLVTYPSYSGAYPAICAIISTALVTSPFFLYSALI